MPTFEQKQIQSQQTTSARLGRANLATAGSHHHTHPILHLQRTIGNQAVQRLLQANAEEFKGGSATTASGHFTPQAADVEKTEAPPIVQEVLNSAGEPLDLATREIMEPGFGYDFSQVRVHTNAQAAESSRAVNALAYTAGEHVVFAADQYAPGTSAGTSLLAHELTHVVQQSNGPVALQRQPDDRELLSRDLKEISDELEKIRQQLGEGAENLEIFRAELALASQKLPRAEIPIDRKTGPAFVEAAIEGSKVLRPFLTGRLATTSVEKNFTIYDFREQFEDKERELSKNTSVNPTIGRPKPTKQIGGFFHRRTDSIHLPPNPKFGHALHEGIHKYSSVATQNALGVYINEGFTQFFTDEVLTEHGLGSVSHAYGPNLKCAKIVLKWINDDKVALGRAYFQGGTHANIVMQEVMRRLGLTTVGELVRLTADRDGLGLCERIEKVGP